MAFVKQHQPCPLCDSTKACSINDDGSAKCFKCGSWMDNYDDPQRVTEGGKTWTPAKKPVTSQPPPEKVTNIKTHSFKDSEFDIKKCTFNPLKERGLSVDTAKFYGVKSLLDSEGNPLQHWYPYYKDNEIVSYKVRKVKSKDFRWVHLKNVDNKNLFGQQLLSKANRRILTITEGECDAMAIYQMLGSKFPALSVNNGIGCLNEIKSKIELIESFSEIKICFDNEDQAKEIARKVADLIPGKAQIIILPEEYKDANEMLLAGKKELFGKVFWAAQPYTPSGVINLSNKISKLNNREPKNSTPYPWEGLNKKLRGIRQGELVTFTGGTGLGKSSVVRELEHWLLTQTKDNIGIVALEESWERTADGILSIEANKRLYIDDIREEFGEDNYRELSNKVLDGDNENRLWIYSHFGASNFDEILSKVNYMIVGCDCKWIILDHLQMIVAASDEKNERSLIDKIMTELRKIVEKTGAGLILVSHLRRLEGNKGHENGAEVNLSHLRGSGGIAQISDCVIALERNQQASDNSEAQRTRLRILKSRYTGEVGVAGYLQYDIESGRLEEIDDPEGEDFPTETYTSEDDNPYEIPF